MKENQASNKFNLIKNPITGKPRISQACDRCRIKKIKCDGTLPSCTNCSKIGFVCKISDRLTRSSFPKGYTKNLEQKLIDMELDRNRLMLELNRIKKEGFDGSNNTVTMTSSVSSSDNLKNEDSSDCQSVSVSLSSTSGSSQSPEPKQDDFSFRVGMDGSFVLNQFSKSPLMDYIKSLNVLQFNGCANFDQSFSDDPLVLNKYHMNLNRFLNLIFYKLLLPLIHRNSNTLNEKFAEDNNSLDSLIWKFFTNYNKLIPILEFDSFYKDYLQFIHKYYSNNQVFVDGFRKYFEFSEFEQCFIVKLILILKFTLPVIHDTSVPSEIYRLISMDSLQRLFGNIDFLKPSIDKVSILLLVLHYMVLYESPRSLLDTQDETQKYDEFIGNLLSTAVHHITSLRLHIDPRKLQFPRPLPSNGNRLRIKLSWCYKLISKLFRVIYNIDNESLFSLDDSNLPELQSISILHEELDVTIQFNNLLDLIPNNFHSLRDKQSLSKIKNQLLEWHKNFNTEFVEHFNLNDTDSDELSAEKINVLRSKLISLNRLNCYNSYFQLVIELQLKENLDSVVSGIFGLSNEMLIDNKSSTELLNTLQQTPIIHQSSILVSLCYRIQTGNLQDDICSILVNNYEKLLQCNDAGLPIKILPQLVHYFKGKISTNISSSAAHDDLMNMFTLNDNLSTTTTDLDSFIIPPKRKQDQTLPIGTKRSKSASTSSVISSDDCSLFSNSLSVPTTFSGSSISVGMDNPPSSLFGSYKRPPSIVKQESTINPRSNGANTDSNLFDTFNDSIKGSLNNGLKKLKDIRCNSVVERSHSSQRNDFLMDHEDSITKETINFSELFTCGTPTASQNIDRSPKSLLLNDLAIAPDTLVIKPDAEDLDRLKNKIRSVKSTVH
ncbi:BA75_04791T0 [Komagataella pastoris]|uniref:BA75_04791T0 n=1 Tax=Komagataella pastoris TaxID=4922 RepID=A0A1B2JIY6_PICPA|nr:BA75_04791T0 [Komagataella pastoris]